MVRGSQRELDQAVVHCDPEILGGTAVFIGTRVPLKNLFDYLEAGDSLEKFLDAFPTVSRGQAITALEQANEYLTANARVAG
jgi:uncharacterized protein (DUF433 family)